MRNSWLAFETNLVSTIFEWLPRSVGAGLSGLVFYGSLAAAEEASLGLPLHEEFSGMALAPEWIQDLAEGASVSARDGNLVISAKSNTFAHLRRPMNVDNVRVNYVLQPDWSEIWAPSLFLYWDNANWCKITFCPLVLPASPLQPYCGLMEGGVLIEGLGLLDHDQSGVLRYDVAACRLVSKTPAEMGILDKWQYLGIDLTPDKIYFLISQDGKTWTRYRFMKRETALLKQPPKYLIVGKGDSHPGEGRDSEFLNNSSKPENQGALVESRIASVAVVPLTEDMVKETHQQVLVGRDVLGEAILAMQGDPTFDRVKDVFPPMQFSRELVGVKDHPQDFGIAPDGAIQFAGGYFYINVGSPATRFGIDRELPTARKRLNRGYLPIVQSKWSHEALEYEQCVFGYSEDFSEDLPIFAYVNLTVTNPTDSARTVYVEGRMNDAKGVPANNGKPVVAWNLTLPAKGKQSVIAKVPFGFAERVEQPSPEVYAALLAKNERYWDELLHQAAIIQVPEERVQNAYRAWLAYNFLNVCKHDGVYEPKDGSGFYDRANEVYGVSAALYCRVLDQYGYHDASQRYLNSLLHYLKPDGSFVTWFGLPDTGAYLIAIDEHYQLTHDRGWLKSMGPSILKMANWIVDRRKQDSAKQSSDAIYYGMIFEKPYCDYPQKAYSFYGDLYLAAGLFSAATSLKDIEMPDEAHRFHIEAEAYRAAILQAMKRSAIELDGLKAIPIFPETHALFKAANYTAFDYYGLVCGLLLEKGFIDPKGWEAKTFVDMIEQRGGLTMGVDRIMGGIDHAYSYGYWYNCLQRGEVRKVLLGLYSSLAFGMTRDTYSGVELTWMRSGMNTQMLPHLFSSTQQLQLLRMMLVDEEGNDLMLCHAVPTAWLADGQKIMVSNICTRFGKLSFEINSQIKEGKIIVKIQPPVAAPVEQIRLKLRHPEGKTIRSAIANGKAAKFQGDTVLLKNLSSETIVEVTF